MSIVPAENLNTLDNLPREAQEVALTQMLTEADSWLSHAVEATEPARAADFKAWASTVMEATRQKRLSQNVQTKAAVMVRRAERNVGIAARKGQEDGTFKTPGQHLSPALPDKESTSVRELFNGGGEYSDSLQMARTDDETFNDALAEAELEGNVSRANVVRKVKNQAGPVTRDQRADVIADLAEQGYTSRQMPAKVGVSEQTVRQIARDFDIPIPADQIVGKTKRLDHTQMVESTVTDLVNTSEFIESFIDLSQVDFTEADEWVASLTTAIRVLNRFTKQIKETAHVQ